MKDPETNAIIQIAEALSCLEATAIHRVLDYVNSRYRASSSNGDARITRSETIDPGDTDSSPRPSSAPLQPKLRENFVTFYLANRPSTREGKVLLAAYYLRSIACREDFDSYTLNQLLKEVYSESNNITRDLSRLEDDELVAQDKLGDSPQARKLYRLTKNGVERVEGQIGRVNRF